MEEVKQKISASGLKATQQRIVVYEALLKLNNHPTAENVYESIRPANPSISLGTVYKTLDTLAIAGLADKVMTDEGYLRYDGNMHHHGHIYCSNTQEIIDFEDDELHGILKDYFTKKKINNLSVKDIKIQILGEKLDKESNVTYQV